MNILKKDSFYFFGLGAIALIIGLYFRLYPLFFHTNPDATEKATVLVIAQLKTTVAKRVEQEYPDIPVYQRNSMIKKSFDDLLHREGPNVRKTIERVAGQIEKETGSTPPYLLESDSFNYYNLTENILKTGRISDTIKGSKYLNPLMMAPNGYFEPLNLHPYVGYAVYRAAKIFKPDIPLMSAVAYTSCVITFLTLIVFVLLCRNLGCRPLSAFIGAVFFLLAPIFIKRSCYGWYDNDPYNALFPIYILLCLFKGFETKTRREALGWAAAASLLTMIYALFWQGWVFFFSLIVGCGIVLCLLNLFYFKDHGETRRLAFFFASLIGGIFIAVALIFGIKDFFVLFEEGWVALQGFVNPSLSLWPDMYISVGELHKASFQELIELTGGVLFFLGTIVGMIGSFIIAHRRQDKLAFYKITILSVFGGLTVYLTLGAQRFALLCLIPMSLLFTLGMQIIADGLKNFFIKRSRGSEPKRFLAQVFPFVLVLMTVIPIVKAHQTTLSLLNRIFNDTWNQALNRIAQETPTNSIINTWWPPGHFIKAVAHRRVTFDGATINKPQAYWMANILLNNDEKKALGLLRMLNNGGNAPVDYLLQQGLPLSQAVDLLKQGTAQNPQQALTLYNRTLRPDQSQRLWQWTHLPPPPSYLFIYNELVEKNLVLSFVDRWNFKKIEDINSNPELLKAIPGRKSKEYVKFLWDIAGGPLLYSELLTLLTQQIDLLIFDQGLQIDLKTHSARINSAQYGRGVPQYLLYLDGNNLVKKAQKNPNLPYTVVLFKQDDRFGAVLMDSRLADSILVRLYYFNGSGLKYIRPVIEEADLTKRTRILVYEVDWEKFQRDFDTGKI